MTSEEIVALYEKHDDEFLKFSRIPGDKRLHRCPDLCGMLYLHSKFGGKKNRYGEYRDMITAAEHDEIWLDYNVSELDLTSDDVLYLTRCGIRYSEKVDSFTLYV